jgi:hypothetical protein
VQRPAGKGGEALAIGHEGAACAVILFWAELPLEGRQMEGPQSGELELVLTDLSVEKVVERRA